MLKIIGLTVGFVLSFCISFELKACNSIENQYKIGKIIIESTGAMDPIPLKPRPYQRFATWLSPTTNPSLIYKYIQVKQGDVLSQEELLRIGKRLEALSYFKSVSVIKKITLLEDETAVVDITIRTRDQFPMSLSLSLEEGPLLTVTHNNICGYGHIFHNQFFLKKRWGYGLEYAIPQIHGTYFIGTQWYKQTENAHTYAFDCKNLWLGKSFIKKRKTDLPPCYWLVTLGGYKKTFHTRPTVSAIQNAIYHHYRLILGKIGCVIDGYQKAKGIYSLHSSESIPKGESIEILYGYQKGEFNNRQYVGINCIKNIANNAFGYLSFSCKTGAFLYHKSLEEGVLKLDFNYASSNQRTTRHGMRQFFRLNYIMGYRMPQERSLGIRKGDPESLCGQKKENAIYAITKPINARLNCSILSTFHTPILIHHVYFALLGFSDLIALYDRDYNLLNATLIDTCGLGFRLQHTTIKWITVDCKVGYNALLGKLAPSVTLSTCCFENKIAPKPSLIAYN